MLKIITRWLLLVIVAVTIGLAGFFISMRFADGPMGIVSGGAFSTGVVAAAPSNWSFLEGREVIEFQTVAPETSRTVWLVVFDGQLYLVSGYMNTDFGKIWKQWPHYIEKDNRVILRIDGKLYQQQLQRLMTGDVIAPVMVKFSEKYQLSGGSGEDIAAMIARGDTWLYQVVP
ncbi:MAG: hypothetical protein HN432_15125 [Gammaproteobacteria bacterium]|nr:hypothetical protein [Gammaproteobacteria bacterium]